MAIVVGIVSRRGIRIEAHNKTSPIIKAGTVKVLLLLYESSKTGVHKYQDRTPQ